jgi:hypothetical protein
MARSVHDTVDEIELEARNQHTAGWVIHAYLKVFNKWLNNLGNTRATFEHIKNAVTSAFDAKEDIKMVENIERFDVFCLIDITECKKNTYQIPKKLVRYTIYMK